MTHACKVPIDNSEGVFGFTMWPVRCSCCGEDRDDSIVSTLRCHDHVAVFCDCFGWLNDRAGEIDVTPTLPVADMDDAVTFCEAAGFEVERYDGGFAFVQLGGQSVFDLDLISEMDPALNHAGCYIVTGDVGRWHGRLLAAGLPVSTIEDKPWGMREFRLMGPSGSKFAWGTARRKANGRRQSAIRRTRPDKRRTIDLAPGDRPIPAQGKVEPTRCGETRDSG